MTNKDYQTLGKIISSFNTIIKAEKWARAFDMLCLAKGGLNLEGLNRIQIEFINKVLEERKNEIEDYNIFDKYGNYKFPDYSDIDYKNTILKEKNK